MMPDTATTLQATPAIEPRTNAAATFFRLIYGNVSGYVEIVPGVNDPSNPSEILLATEAREWFIYTPQRLGQLLELVDHLAAKYDNVYCSVHVYQRPRRNASIKPGRTIVVDDLPANVDCSFWVQTSPNSRQGYFLLTHDAPAEVLEDLAKRAAYTLGGDHSGWDLQQLVRIPGTRNTKAKYGTPYPIHLAIGNRTRYDSEKLRATWPDVSTTSSTTEQLDWPEVEHWLGNLGALINTDGLPRRVKPTTQTARILRHGIDDTSLARFIVAKGLALHGYPDNEIAALLWHYCDYGKAKAKGSAWLKEDIQRIVGKVRTELKDTKSSPTRLTHDQPTAAIAEVQRPKRGRHTVLTPEALLQWYRQQAVCSDVVMLSRAEVATQLRVSIPTVQRCERALRAAGELERRPFNRRQSSMVVLLRSVSTSDQKAPATPENTAAHVRSDDTAIPHQGAESTTSAVHEGTHPQDRPPQAAPARPSARAAIAEVFDAYGGVRLTRKRVLCYLASNYPTLTLSPATLDRLVKDERERRARQKKLAILPSLSVRTLKAELRLAEHCADKSRAQGTNEWKWWTFYAAQLSAELQRRPAEPQKRRRGVVEAVPHPREAGRHYEQELLEVVAQDRERRPLARGPSAGVCSPQPTFQLIPALVDAPPVSDPAGLIKRLRARIVAQAV